MSENKLKDLREIALWQSLNKQLLSFKRRGKPIKDTHHVSLQEFCFNNRISSKVTENKLTSDIPLALVTDFHNVYFITVNLKTWTDTLLQLIPNTYSLNIEKARANAFKIMLAYDNKFHLVHPDVIVDENDTELYEFYNEYADAKESIGMDLSALALQTHKLKGIALKKIINNKDYKFLVEKQSGYTILRFSGLKKDDGKAKHQGVLPIYQDFCLKADPHKKGNQVKWANEMLNIRRSFLERKCKEKGSDRSVRNFAKQEIGIFDEEYKLIVKFSKESKIKKNEIETFHEINICSTEPFFFLDHPLPLL